MRRRLLIARALVHRPRLAILDEPTAGVDPQSRASLLELVRSLAAEGAAIIARRLNTESHSFGAAMALIRVPWNGNPLDFRARLLAAGTDAPVHAVGGARLICQHLHRLRPIF